MLRQVAERLDSHRERSVALLRAAATILGAIEVALLQPPARRDYLFFPSAECLERLLAHMSRASRTLDVCVYDLTDTRIRDALLVRHKAGVRVRVISDHENATHTSSAILQLAAEGVATLVDATSAHVTQRPALTHLMHHKFVLVDEALLLTGSFNMTYSASSKNFENILLTDDAYLVQKYAGEFERLWHLFWGGTFGGGVADSHLLAVVKLQSIQRGKVSRRASIPPIGGMQEFPDLVKGAQAGRGAAPFALPAAQTEVQRKH